MEFTKNLIYAKCRTDWLFYDSNGEVIPYPLKVDVKTIAFNSNCFRFQKNAKMNNKVVHYKSLPNHPKWYSTQAKLEILARAECLNVLDDRPLAV